MTSLAWMDQAVCARISGWHQAEPADQAETCGHCPVQAECIRYGLMQEPPTGVEADWPVYGGLTRGQRVSRRRRHGLQAGVS